MTALDRRVLTVGVDVTQRASIDVVVAHVEAELGEVNILVNVAGLVSFGSGEELTEGEWNQVIDVNPKGSFLDRGVALDGAGYLRQPGSPRAGRRRKAELCGGDDPAVNIIELANRFDTRRNVLDSLQVANKRRR